MLANIPEGAEKIRIRTALINSIISCVGELRDAIRGRTKAEAANLFKKPPLNLTTANDALMLAKLFFEGNAFSFPSSHHF